MKKVLSLITYRKILILEVLFIVFLLLPIFYLIPIDRAAGDDLGYGAAAHVVWVNSHSVIGVLQEAINNIKSSYDTWQGTWFSIFLFTLQPEVFGDGLYWITPIIMLGLWLMGIITAFRVIGVDLLSLTVEFVYILSLSVWILTVEFIPRTTASIYWWVGSTHYMVPFSMCMFLLSLLIKFVNKNKWKYFWGVTVLATLLGGSNYQAALLSLLIIGSVLIYALLNKVGKRCLVLLVPIATELVGLIISVLAPGNKVRGGENFGFSFDKIIQTIFECFKKGTVEAFRTYADNKLLLLAMLFLFVILWNYFSTHQIKVAHKWFIMVALIGTYYAMQAPEIFAGVDVSAGVPNTNFLVLVLVSFGIELIVASVFSKRVSIRTFGVGISFLLFAVLSIFFKGNFKDTSSYQCYDYIALGRAMDYKEQISLQTRILESEDMDVIVPFMSDDQGPLMHMPITSDPTAWTNQVYSKFYEKNSVIAIPRDEWIQNYEKEYIVHN